MTASDDDGRSMTQTALLVFDVEAAAPETGPARSQPPALAALLEVLPEYGFEVGPVVGGVCAVTGPVERIAALIDHVSVIDAHPIPVGADRTLLALLRNVVADIVIDDPVETMFGDDVVVDADPNRTDRDPEPAPGGDHDDNEDHHNDDEDHGNDDHDDNPASTFD